MQQVNTNKKILTDFKRIQEDPPEGCCISPLNDNLYLWGGYIFGPEQTIWEGGTFYLEIVIPENYPQNAPKIYFKPPILHPNVHIDQNQNQGLVSMDIVKSNWSPLIDLWTLLISLRSLLTDPNPTTFANQQAHTLYFKERTVFNEKIKKFIENYVSEDPNFQESEDEEEEQNTKEQKIKIMNQILYNKD